MVVANGRILSGIGGHSKADTVAIQLDRILAVGPYRELAPLVDRHTEVVDAESGLIVPAFHDAHMHLRSWARMHARVDCAGVRSLPELHERIRRGAASQPPGSWVRAAGYDEMLLPRHEHPSRHDLDAAAPDHPVRLQHRTLHLDVLNTAALYKTDLWSSAAPEIERGQGDGQPTGRLFNAGVLLRDRLPRATVAELAIDIRRATDQLLAWGITTVQDASVINGLQEWELFRSLAARDDLRVRVFMMVGLANWRQFAGVPTAERRLQLGPVKVMLDEATSDASALGPDVQEVLASGRSVAFHATTEAEMAIALDLLRSRPVRLHRHPDRLEHASVVPDAWLAELAQLDLDVVGQPAQVYERGDWYRQAYAPEQWNWLHRARSFGPAGVVYAVGSDAPVGDPHPGVALHSLRYRRTRNGAVLGEAESLPLLLALQTMTSNPAHAVGMAPRLGTLAPAAIADIAILDPELLTETSALDCRRDVRVTIMEGRVVWRREAAYRRSEVVKQPHSTCSATAATPAPQHRPGERSNDRADH